ncbi:MAG: hypothetical protein M4579_005792 [Chaenotheca gracillima]|nr:MAG: hypothetical protein M4579_005792 [Chaenotheca gracillima]
MEAETREPATALRMDLTPRYGTSSFVVADAHPNSQESLSSTTTDGDARAQHHDSTNPSQSTVAETDPTPPSSSQGRPAQSQESEASWLAQLKQAKDAADATRAIESQPDRKVEGAVESSDQTDPLQDVESAREVVNRYPTQGAAGSKRTASGEIKSPSSASPTRPHHAIPPLHSRSVSTEGGQRASELSSQLRARLSYAMVKVQHGWQSRSIDEVESIAASQLSPMSTTSTLRDHWPRAVRSPTDPPSSLSRENSGKSSDVQMSSGSPEIVSSAVGDIANGASGFHRAQHRATEVSPPSSASGRTYESFWRDHGATSAVKVLETQRGAAGPPQGNHAPILAPPADITPRNHGRRSSTSNDKHPPTISTNIPSGTRPLSSSTSLPPSTPPPDSSNGSTNGIRRDALIRTPSQKRAMEQDAVETLMFMSNSPGNSQQSRDQLSQQSHLLSPRRAAAADDKRNGWRAGGYEPAQQPTSPHGSSQPNGFRSGYPHASSSAAHHSHQQSTRKTADDEMDARLDEVSDESSDGEF